MDPNLHFETRAICAGQAPDPTTGSTITPIHQTATFTQEIVGSDQPYQYSRGANPTRTALEEALASLESANFGIAFSSGMAAIASVVHLLKTGDNILVADDLYGGSYRLFSEVLPRHGISITYFDGSKVSDLKKRIKKSTKLVWLESPTNPMVRLQDISACSEVTKKRNILTVIDNTFASPYFQRPLELGADVVVHSTTKYISGHSDVIGGAVLTNDEEYANALRTLRTTTGGVPGPWDTWLTLRGLKTLAVRMRAHEENAFAIAEFLENRPEIEKVYFPGLPNFDGHELAKRQMHGFGGIVTLDLKGGERAARDLCEKTSLFSLAESLGGVESLIGYPWLMSHAAFSESLKIKKGISKSTVRLSIGLEHADDLCDDLAQAFSACT